MDLSVDVSRVGRLGVGHVAILAALRFRRVVKRTRTKARYPTRLPVVVLVEAAEPAIVVDRNVEMHLVARRAEFRRLAAHEGLEEDATVGLGIEIDAEIVNPAQRR